MLVGLKEAPLQTMTRNIPHEKSPIHALDELGQGFKPFLESRGLNFLFQGFGLLCKCQIYILLSMVLLHGPGSLQTTC